MQPKLCRACGKSTNVDRSLNMFEEPNQAILEHLTLLTGVSFENSTVLPTLLCIYCQIRTNQAISFRERCLEVQRELLESLNDEDLLQIPDDYRRIFEPEDHSIQSQITIHIEGVEDDDGSDYDADLQELLSEAEVYKDSSPRQSQNTENKDNIDLYDENYSNVEYLKSESDGEKEDELLLKPISPKTKKISRKPEKADGEFVCKECGNHYKREKDLAIHSNRHRVKNHVCEVCKDSFCTTSELNRHKRKHTGEKPYSCRHCQRCFSDYSARMKHERSHTNNRPFVCKECGKGFNTAYVLKNHMLRHTGERAFRCDSCDKSFSRDVHLSVHFRSKTHKRNLKKEEKKPLRSAVKPEY